MLSAIRSRLSYANVAATLALFFALGGGAAWAASRYIITSSKQISPKVIKELKGHNGKKGATGPQGPAGAPGAKGENGANGTNGANGKDGASVVAAAASGTECKAGGTKFEVQGSGKSEHVCNGERGQTGFSEYLPESKTETGAWAAVSVPPEAGFNDPTDTSISYNIPLKEASKATHVIGIEEGFKEPKEAEAIQKGECSGTVEEPGAGPGNLCVFVKSETNVLFTVLPPNVSGKVGALVGLLASEANKYLQAYGTWAVTEEVGVGTL